MDELRKDYWMVRKLGSGGFGTVYLIKHRNTREYFAAKQQPCHNYREKLYIKKEVSILKQLSNPDKRFVVQFVNFFEGDNQSMILTEFLEGDELFRRISAAKYNLTETKCRSFARQILNAIEFIHSRGIVHLDLKPENIVLQENIKRKSSSFAGLVGDNQTNLCSALAANCSSIASIATESSMNSEQLKIIDFGLARDMEGKNQIPINLCGTIEYISPEVMRCSHASFASDMWSIGVIFYMMVTGGLSPFWAENELRTQRQIRRGQFANGGFDNKLFKEVPDSAIDCISRLLNVNSQMRLTSSECLNHKWLTSDFFDTAKRVNTVTLRKYLARRRWKKLFIAIKAMNRMTQLGIFASFTNAMNTLDNIASIIPEPSNLNEVWL
jgi:serine/threonine protein kinase